MPEPKTGGGLIGWFMNPLLCRLHIAFNGRQTIGPQTSEPIRLFPAGGVTANELGAVNLMDVRWVSSRHGGTQNSVLTAEDIAAVIGVTSQLGSEAQEFDNEPIHGFRAG